MHIKFTPQISCQWLLILNEIEEMYLLGPREAKTEEKADHAEYQLRRNPGGKNYAGMDANST